MTGFLDRMAARAAGDAAGAAPRVPARFEGTAGGRQAPAGPGEGAVHGLATGREQSEVRLLATAQATAPRAAAITGTGPGEMAAAAANGGPRSASPRPVTPAPRDGEPGASRGAGPLDGVAGATASVVEPPLGLGAIGPGQANEAPSRRRELAPSPALPASPAPSPVAAVPGNLPPGPVARDRDPDVVRVTIGRVEIRAAVPPPVTRPARAAAPGRTPDALPLGDYLRGRRGAG